jgi:hypothetical protein
MNDSNNEHDRPESATDEAAAETKHENEASAPAEAAQSEQPEAVNEAESNGVPVDSQGTPSTNSTAPVEQTEQDSAETIPDDRNVTRRRSFKTRDTALLSPQVLDDDESEILETAWRRVGTGSDDEDDPSLTPPQKPDSIFGDKVDTAVIAKNLLRSKPGETKIPDGLLGPTDKREIILVIRGMVERRVMQENKPIVLGRADMKSRFLPDVDLTPYGALDRGVSREHATLQLDGDSLYVTDLDSTNGTILAGKRLTPHVKTILRKGDELLLGRLPVQVLFR